MRTLRPAERLGWSAHSHSPKRAGGAAHGVRGTVRSGAGYRPLPHPALSVADLTSKQRAHLRALAHDLKPVAHVGKEGVTDGAVAALRQTFETHEVVKVRVLEAAPDDARTTAHALAERIDGATVVQTVGRNATLYRADPDDPTIRLPAR